MRNERKPTLPWQAFRGVSNFDAITAMVQNMQRDWTPEQVKEEARLIFDRKSKLALARGGNAIAINTGIEYVKQRASEIAKDKCPGLMDKADFKTFVDALAVEFGKRVDITRAELYAQATPEELKIALAVLSKAAKTTVIAAVTKRQIERQRLWEENLAEAIEWKNNGTLEANLAELEARGDVKTASELRDYFYPEVLPVGGTLPEGTQPIDDAARSGDPAPVSAAKPPLTSEELEAQKRARKKRIAMQRLLLDS